MNTGAHLDLTPEELLVLFDFLSSRIDTADEKQEFDFSNPDLAQKVALNNLLSALEPVIPTSFSENYTQLVSEAKNHLTKDIDPSLF